MFDYVKRRKRRSRLGIKFKLNELNKLKLVNYIAIFIFVSFIFIFFATLGLFAWYARDLPSPQKIKRHSGLSTIIYDRNEKVLYDIYREQNRVPIKLEDIPKDLKNATIAIEDKDFYTHKGFDPKGMLRAIFNILIYHRLQGGSTLTQQLVKNVLLTPQRTIPRKIKEFMLTVQIERRYSKDEILQMYLNETPYGGTAWGVETAAQTYFGKPAKDLNLIESALLAGLPQAPTSYSPFGPNPKAYIWRTEQVLRRMKEDNYITTQQEMEARKELANFHFVSQKHDIKAPHFVMYIKQKLVDQFGEEMVEQGGLRVTTTLNLDLQEKAQEIVKEEIGKVKNLNVTNGASVILDPQNGEILTMIGSKDYFAGENESDQETSEVNFEGKFNVVTSGLRQPGSAIKPVTYAVAFSKGYTPATMLMDVETHYPGGVNKPDYVPKNYDDKFRGPIQLRFALGNSVNAIAVKMLALVGVRDMLDTAYKMGLKTLEPTADNIKKFGLSITLGGGEVKLIDLASAYGVFANGGQYYEPYGILKVTDINNKVIFEKKNVKGKKVLSPDVCFLISHILLDNEARKEVFGPRSYLVVPGKTVSVKTGTTDDKRDNWTVGYTPQIVAAVWVGNNDNSSMNERLASGITGAAPIWNRVMREALKDKSDQQPPKPDNIVNLQIDAFAGGLPKEGMPQRSEYFIKGTESHQISSIYQKLKIAKSDGKLANAIQIANGDYEEKEFFVIKEKDPFAVNDKNHWQETIDEWLRQQTDERYHPPTETSTAKENEVIVDIKSPKDHDRLDDNDIKVEAKASTLNEIIKIKLEIDGNLVETFSNASFSQMVTLDTGTHRIKVKAYDNKGHEGEREINIGIKVPWDWVKKEPTNTPIPLPSSTPTINPSPTLSPAPSL